MSGSLGRIFATTSKPTEPFKKLVIPPAANDNEIGDSIDAQTLLGIEFAPIDYVVPG